MKKAIWIFLSFSLLICCKTINSSGYKIVTESLGYSTSVAPLRGFTAVRANAEGTGIYTAHSVLCDNEVGYSLYQLNDTIYLCKVEYNGSTFFVIINEMAHKISIDDILPESVARKRFDQIISETTEFNSLAELNMCIEQQKRIEDNRRIQEQRRLEQERIAEEKRLFEEIDQRYGVTSAVWISTAKTNDLIIGNVYRLNNLFFSNREYRSNGNILLFGEFDEYEILGFQNMINADAKEIIHRQSMPYPLRAREQYLGRKGYIVRYLGPKEVITRAGLVRIIWEFEYIGVNKYVE